MILEVTPDKIAKGNFYNSKGEMVSLPYLARIYGADYEYEQTKIIWQPVIMEVRLHGKQHFVVRNGRDIYDPASITGKPLAKYNPISYRNLKKNESVTVPTVPERIIEMIKNYDQLSDQDKQWVWMMIEDFVRSWYWNILGREIESNEQARAHTATIVNDKSGDGWNGIGHWIQAQVADSQNEMYSKWQRK